MKLDSEIGPRSRVYVKASNKYGQDISYYGTVIEWTKSGLLKVDADLISASGRQIKCVSAEKVRLLR